MSETSEPSPREVPTGPSSFISRRPTSGVLALLIMVALVVALVATHSLGVAFGQPIAAAGSTPASIGQPQRAGAPGSPLVTPYTTPTSFSPSESYQAAWGPHAATADYSMTIDASHIFNPSAVAPDGRTLLGDEQITNVGIQAGYFDPVTRHFTAIGVSNGGGNIQCCMSDGRFVVAADNTQPMTTEAILHWRYWAYDMWTGRLRMVASGDTYGGVSSVALVHGLLYLSSGKGMLVANLAAGTIAPLLAGQSTSGSTGVVYSWPYLVYIAESSTDLTSSFEVYNLATGRNSALPALGLFDGEHGGFGDNHALAYSIAGDSLIGAETIVQSEPPDSNAEISTTTFYALDHVLSGGTQVTSLGTFTSEGSPGYAVAGDTLYVSVLSGQVTSQTLDILHIGWTTLCAIDHITSGGTPPQVLGTFDGDALDMVGANARVIAFSGGMWDATSQQLGGEPVLWDLAVHTFVTFPASSGFNSSGDDSQILVNLAGNELTVVQGNQAVEAVMFFDTARLPAAAATG